VDPASRLRRTHPVDPSSLLSQGRPEPVGSITYDSDIGLELAQASEFAPLIIEPLKMQGVEAFGEFAVQIRMKMMPAWRAVRHPVEGLGDDQSGV
jgi:hypothetical protein